MHRKRIRKEFHKILIFLFPSAIHPKRSWASPSPLFEHQAEPPQLRRELVFHLRLDVARVEARGEPELVPCDEGRGREADLRER